MSRYTWNLKEIGEITHTGVIYVILKTHIWVFKRINPFNYTDYALFKQKIEMALNVFVS